MSWSCRKRPKVGCSMKGLNVPRSSQVSIIPIVTKKPALMRQVFPQMQLLMFPRLERFDVDFDLPEAFLPEFPPALFLQNRPELGDVSRGEVVSINNFYRLFKDILTPVQLS